MPLVANAHERARVARTVGIVLLIAAPGLAFGTWYSTRQPLEMLEWSNQNRARISAEAYGSAVYMGAHAQRTIDEMWKPNGFATLGIAGTLVGIGLLLFARRQSAKAV